MKLFYILLTAFLICSCSSSDDSNSITKCEYSDYYWLKSNDSITENGISKYKAVLNVTIKNREDIVRPCKCEFVSNPDSQNNRYTAEGESSIILESEQTLPISFLSTNYLTQEQINLEVDYVNDIPVE